jgi:hypothetical protein
MESIGTTLVIRSTTSVRRVAIIGAPPGLGLGITLLAASPRFRGSAQSRPQRPATPR